MVKEPTEYRKKQYKKVAKFLKKGLTQKEIAEKLNRSETVVSEIISEMRKLNTKKDWFEDIPIPLTAKELENKVINEIIKNPKTKTREIAKKYNITKDGIRRILKRHGGRDRIFLKRGILPIHRKRIPNNYWTYLETRRLFFKWITCMISAAPKEGATSSKDIKFIKNLGLKKYKKRPSVNFLRRNIPIYKSSYEWFYLKESTYNKMLSDWTEASQSIDVKFLQDCFKIFDKGYIKNGLDSDKIYAHYNGSPPENSKPIYFYVSAKRRMHKLRQKVGGKELVANKPFYSTLKTLKNLNFIEKKEHTIIGGKWDKHKKDCYIITLDFEREKFKPVFDKLGVDIWGKPNNNIGY